MLSPCACTALLLITIATITGHHYRHPTRRPSRHNISKGRALFADLGIIMQSAVLLLLLLRETKWPGAIHTLHISASSLHTASWWEEQEEEEKEVIKTPSSSHKVAAATGEKDYRHSFNTAALTDRSHHRRDHLFVGPRPSVPLALPISTTRSSLDGTNYHVFFMIFLHLVHVAAMRTHGVQ